MIKRVLELKHKCEVCGEFYAKYLVFEIRPNLLGADNVGYKYVCSDCLEKVVK